MRDDDDDDDATPVTRDQARDPRLLTLLDAARALASLEDTDAYRSRAVQALSQAATAWSSDPCSICGRRGDHEWEELTTAERIAHEAEASRQGA